MYQTSLYFKIKDSPGMENYHIFDIFFRAWIDNHCNNEVSYKMEHVEYLHPAPHISELFRVDFEKIEDAVMVKLTGVPFEFRDYIELVN